MNSTSDRRLRLLVAFFAGVALTAAVSSLAYWWRDQGSVQHLGAAAEKAEHKGKRVSGYEMVPKLREGGYILYFRHGNRAKWDSVVAFDIVELASGADASKATYADAVCLSAQGREEAKMIGKVLALARIPVGHVASSPVCRARQTAQLAFGRIDGVHMALSHTPVVNTANAAGFKAALQDVLTNIPVRPNTNTVITAHENTIRNHADLFAAGANWFSFGMVQEGGAYVIKRHVDGRLEVVYQFAGLADLAAAGITLPVRGSETVK